MRFVSDTYDPHRSVKDDYPPYHGRSIIHRFTLRESDLWSLDAWLGPALAIMLEAFLEQSERMTERDQWHEEMHEVAKDLRLLGSPEYWYKDEVKEKAEAAMKKFAEQIGGMWW
jgi:hypothetical protein